MKKTDAKLPKDDKSFNLPDITVEKDVPVESLGQEVPVKRANIDLMLSKDGKQVLAVFLVPKNQYRIAKYINSMNICEDAGVPAIRFMKEFMNCAGITQQTRQLIFL